MAESPKGGGGKQAPSANELPMEMRLLLAFVLMGLVMLLSPYFMPKSPTPARKAADTHATTGQDAGKPPEPGPPEGRQTAGAGAPPPAAPAVTERPLDPLPIETDQFQVVFSNQGGSVRSWQLKKYKGNDDRMLELTNTASGRDFPLSLYFPVSPADDDADWQTRGVTGTVVRTDTAKGTFTIALGSGDAEVKPGANGTAYRRFRQVALRNSLDWAAPEAAASNLGELQAGDSVRVLGDKGEDGAIVAEKAISGTTLNWAYFKETPDRDKLGVTYEFSDGHASVRKRFRFEKASYVCQVSTEVTLDGKPVPHLVEWRGGFGDLTIRVPSSDTITLYFDSTANKLQDQGARAAKNGPVTASGDFSFAGVADKYFAAMFLPEGRSTVKQTTFGDWTRTPREEKPQDFAGVAVSDGEVNRFRLFVGPKDLPLLKKVDPKLEQVVNFQFWSIPGSEYLVKFLFFVVDWTYNSFVHNFGWAIVVVTVAINLVLFPLRLTSMKSARKMQALKPQIDAINAKYKNIGLSDPKKAEQQQEVMDLYKKHGVNPMGGCVPMLLQMPFLIAFYRVFMVSVVMRGASWLWVKDLSQEECLAANAVLSVNILPIVMIATQFLMQKMTPQANVDPNSQKMMYMMPLVMGWIFYHLPSGLVLYYLTSNLVNMGQQWFFNRTNAARVAVASVQPPPKRKNGRK
jgi:YidC/Oxa1 family membrane protein insertase